MVIQPFIDKAQCPAWKSPRDNAIFYSNLCFILIVIDMEVRRVVLTYIHIDDNSIKSTDLWHKYLFLLFAANITILSHIRKFRHDFVYLIALRHGVAELRAVGVDIREESFDILLRVTAIG